MDPGCSNPRRRIRLVACHCSNPIIKDYDRDCCIIVHRIHQALDPGVKECGVPDRADYIPFLTRIGNTARYGDRCPHTDGGINPVQLKPKGIAPDITWKYTIPEDLFYRIKMRPGAYIRHKGSVDAGGDPGRICRREFHIRREPRRFHYSTYNGGRKFTFIGRISAFLPENRGYPCDLQYFFFYKRGQFLYHKHPFMTPDELLQPLFVDGGTPRSLRIDVVGGMISEKWYAAAMPLAITASLPRTSALL